MHCKQWIFDMDGTLTDSMTVVWEGAPDALLRRYGRTPRGDLRATLLNMGMQEGAQYLIREYGLPLHRYRGRSRSSGWRQGAVQARHPQAQRSPPPDGQGRASGCSRPAPSAARRHSRREGRRR